MRITGEVPRREVCWVFHTRPLPPRLPISSTPSFFLSLNKGSRLSKQQGLVSKLPLTYSRKPLLCTKQLVGQRSSLSQASTKSPCHCDFTGSHEMAESLTTVGMHDNPLSVNAAPHISSARSPDTYLTTYRYTHQTSIVSFSSRL